MKRLAALLLALALPAAAQDYGREQRWAAEIVPNLVVGDAIRIEGAAGTFLGIYTEAKNEKAAVLLVHGIGVHPDHGVIGILRTALPELGYATLSIQMPVQKADANADAYFPALFPEAAARIRAGADWLAAKGHVRLVLLSHSMGSWMSNVYFESVADSPFSAWICMGRSGAFSGMGKFAKPVLDIYAENDLPSVRRGDWRRRLVLDGIPGSAQAVIPRADHHYTGEEKALAAVIDDFLSKLK